MKVFLTGGRGMVGRNFCDHVGAAGHQIVAPTSNELDLRDRAAVHAVMVSEAPDIVVHAAGRVGGIQANIADPVGFLVDNLDIGTNVVLAAQHAGVPKLLNIGSSCMFPHDAPNPLSEDMVLAGKPEPTNEGYALAKIATARLCDYVSRSNVGLSYKTVIPCNLFGLNDKFDPHVSHLVPAIIRKVHEAAQTDAAEVEIWGDGLARREFMFAGDLAEGLWQAVDRFDAVPSMMNLGVGRDHSINDYYQTIARVIGWQGAFVHDLDRPVGMKQKLVCTKLQDNFGWHPTTSLEDGIAQTYAYFLDLRCGLRTTDNRTRFL